MQATITSRDEVTIKVNRAELALFDYAVGLFQSKASLQTLNFCDEDADRANELEKQLFAVYCQLCDDQAEAA
jgi:hypothetical protein